MSRPSMIAFAICLAGTLCWSLILTYKYTYFGYYDWDLALYAQAVWSVTQGSLDVSLFGTNFLADHGHYAAILIAPLYAIFPHPLTLVHLEVISFFTAAFTLFKLARIHTNTLTAFIVMFCYILHPANIFMLLYEFHFESLSMGLFLLMFYFFERNRYKSFLFTAFIIITLKENMPLMIFMFGFYALIVKAKSKIKWGMPLIFMGIASFIVIMYYLIPSMRQDSLDHSSMYWKLYAHLGSSPKEIILNILLKPWVMFPVVFTFENFIYIKDVLGAFSFSLFFSPAAMLVSAPIFLQNLLTTTSSMHTIYYHYAATIVPFVAVAAMHGFAYLRKKISKLLYNILLFLTAIFTIIHLAHFYPSIEARVKFWEDSRDGIRQDIVNKIPKNAGVIAPFDFLTHLTERKYLYPLYNIWKGKNYFTGKTPLIPKDVRYAIIDYQDPWLKIDMKHNPQIVTSRIRDFLKEGDWHVTYKSSQIVLYER